MAGDEQDWEIKNKFNSILKDVENLLENTVALPPEKEKEKAKI